MTAGRLRPHLTLNADKTQVWSRSHATATPHLPPWLAARWVPDLRLLGAHMPWLDRDEREEALVSVGGSTGGAALLANAKALNQRLRDLWAAGLGLKMGSGA